MSDGRRAAADTHASRSRDRETQETRTNGREKLRKTSERSESRVDGRKKEGTATHTLPSSEESDSDGEKTRRSQVKATGETGTEAGSLHQRRQGECVWE